MKKYLKMENATLELNLGSIGEYTEFIKENIVFIESQNFQRIIIHIIEKEIETLVSEIKDYFKNNTILVMIYSFLHLQKELTVPENFILVNQNEKNQIVSDSVYHNIKLTETSLQRIKKCVKENGNIIIDVIPNINDIAAFNELISKLMINLDGIAINLSGLIIPSFLMREHPCNAYLCDGWKCGKQISCLPKHILIDSNYNVYPHDLIYSKLKIGNVKSHNLKILLEKYLESEEYKKFHKYNERVFIKFLANYPFAYMPLLEYVRSEAENDK